MTEKRSLNLRALDAVYEAYYDAYTGIVGEAESCEEAEQHGLRAAILKYLELTEIAALSLLKEIRDTTPIAAQRKRIDEFLAMGCSVVHTTPESSPQEDSRESLPNRANSRHTRRNHRRGVRRQAR